MSAYIQSPYKPPPILLVPGMPTYLWGGFNDKTGPTQGTILSDSGNGATSTVKFQIVSGNIPIVGALVTIVGTANAAGAYNVTNAPILTVSAATNPDSGIYIITFTGTGNSASTADAGQLIIPQTETSEALTAVASAPASMPYGNSTYNQNQGLTAVVSFPSLPTSVIVSLQQAVQDLDKEYATIATVATVAGGVVTAAGAQITVDPTLGRFFRFSNGTVIGGTLPTIIAKLLM